MSDELKQVDVRLKLVEGNGLYSDKPITNPQEAISVMADVMAGLDRKRSVSSIWTVKDIPSILMW